MTQIVSTLASLLQGAWHPGCTPASQSALYPLFTDNLFPLDLLQQLVSLLAPDLATFLAVFSPLVQHCQQEAASTKVFCLITKVICSVTKVFCLVTKVFPSVTKVFPLITKVFPSITKVFPLVTKFFPPVTKVFHSVTKIFPSVTKVFPSVTKVFP